MKKPATKAERAYMDAVAQLPCMLGHLLGEQHERPQLHHIREGQGMSQRAAHHLVIPLCEACHLQKNGLHGDRTLLRIAKVDELDLLNETIAAVFNRMRIL